MGCVPGAARTSRTPETKPGQPGWGLSASLHLCSGSAFYQCPLSWLRSPHDGRPATPARPCLSASSGQTDEGHVPNRWGCHRVSNRTRATSEAISDVPVGPPRSQTSFLETRRVDPKTGRLRCGKCGPLRFL